MRVSYLENPDYFRRNFARINHSAANFLARVRYKSDERRANGTIDNKIRRQVIKREMEGERLN